MEHLNIQVKPKPHECQQMMSFDIIAEERQEMGERAKGCWSESNLGLSLGTWGTHSTRGVTLMPQFYLGNLGQQ